jgi:hypothetical protein
MFIAPFLIFVVDELDDFPVADLEAHVFRQRQKSIYFPKRI